MENFLSAIAFRVASSSIISIIPFAMLKAQIFNESDPQDTSNQ
jgi:hypothetical protein